jgi:hypothetical protein
VVKLSIHLSLDTLQVLGAKTEKSMEGQLLGAFQNLQTTAKQWRKEHTDNIPSNHTKIFNVGLYSLYGFGS